MQHSSPQKRRSVWDYGLRHPFDHQSVTKGRNWDPGLVREREGFSTLPGLMDLSIFGFGEEVHLERDPRSFWPSHPELEGGIKGR